MSVSDLAGHEHLSKKQRIDEDNDNRSAVVTPAIPSSSVSLPKWKEIDDPDFTFFLEWANRNGCKFSKLKFVEFDLEGRGGLTMEEIPADSEMCSVAMNMVISFKTVRASQAGIAAQPLLEESNLTAEEQQWALWYVYLLHEKGRAQSSWLPEPVSPPSFWTPYFQILPEKILTPISFTEQELDLLKGTNLPDATRKIKAKLKTTYEILFPALFDRFPNLFHRSLFTLKHFLWAYQVFWSRALSVIIDGVQQAAMVPLSDMLNHSSMVSVSYLSDIQTERFLLKTFNTIGKGQQAYNNFGPRSNEKLLLNYGFVLQDNFADCFFVKLGMSNQDPLFESKSRLMSAHNLTFEHYLTKGPTPIDVSLLNALRITLMNDTEIYFFGEEKSISLSPNNLFVSPRNEWLMISTLQKLLTNKLAGFETSIESDRELLSKPSQLSPAQFLSIVCRLGQKEIIQNALQYYIPKLAADFDSRLISSSIQTMDFRGNTKPFPFKHDSNTLAYEKWLRSNAVVHSALSIAELEGEKTFFITEGIAVGTDLITFPQSTLITSENILLDSPYGSKWRTHQEALDDETIVLLFLMEERTRHKSKWSAFFKALATIHSPLMFPDSDMCELDGTSLYEEVTQLRSELVQDSQALFAELNELGLFDSSVHNWNNFIWAKVLFESRVMNGDKNGQSTCIIPPLAFSPKFHPWASLDRKYVGKEDAVIVKNQISYPPNSELMDGTNGQPNHQLFLDHGVVLDGNRDDTLSIELNLGNDKMTMRRELILKRYGIKMEHFLKLGKISPNLLAAVRACVLNRTELETLERENVSILNPISKRNETQMVETLNNLLNGMLMGYSTTIEQDISILRKGNISKNHRLSVMYRKGQKQIIIHALKQLEGHKYKNK